MIMVPPTGSYISIASVKVIDSLVLVVIALHISTLLSKSYLGREIFFDDNFNNSGCSLVRRNITVYPNEYVNRYPKFNEEVCDLFCKSNSSCKKLLTPSDGIYDSYNGTRIFGKEMMTYESSVDNFDCGDQDEYFKRADGALNLGSRIGRLAPIIAPIGHVQEHDLFVRDLNDDLTTCYIDFCTPRTEFVNLTVDCKLFTSFPASEESIEYLLEISISEYEKTTLPEIIEINRAIALLKIIPSSLKCSERPRITLEGHLNNKTFVYTFIVSLHFPCGQSDDQYAYFVVSPNSLVHLGQWHGDLFYIVSRLDLSEDICTKPEIEICAIGGGRKYAATAHVCKNFSCLHFYIPKSTTPKTTIDKLTTTNLPPTKIPPEIQFTQLVDPTNAPRLPTSSSTHQIKSTSKTTAHHVEQILKDEANTGKGVKAVTNFETMMPTKGSSEEGGNVNKMWETLLLILLLILIPILLMACLVFWIHGKRKDQSESYFESYSVPDSELSGTNTETTKGGRSAYLTYLDMD
ncbi:hypothetical protein ACOME3_004243 [Neoechinorhynchus agilis]